MYAFSNQVFNNAEECGMKCSLCTVMFCLGVGVYSILHAERLYELKLKNCYKHKAEKKFSVTSILMSII